MTFMTVSQAKAHFLDMVRNSDDRFERFVITRKGHPAAVLMSADEFDGWLETLDILSDKKALKEIQQARKELESGKGRPFAKVVGKLQRI